MRKGIGTKAPNKGFLNKKGRIATKQLKAKAKANVTINSAKRLGFSQTDARAIAESRKNSSGPSLVTPAQRKAVEQITIARRKALREKVKANLLKKRATRRINTAIQKAKRRI